MASQRKDRSEKLKQRKELDETVVKLSLGAVLQDDDQKNILYEIEKRVEIASKKYHTASVALNFLIRMIFDGHEYMVARKGSLHDFSTRLELMRIHISHMDPPSLLLEEEERFQYLLQECSRS